MSFLDIVRKRRSVRSYRPDPVPREAIDRCIEAARLAPSACNSQPWHFVVVDTPEMKDKFVEAAYSGLHSMNAFARNAPVHIAVVREKAKPAARFGGSSGASTSPLSMSALRANTWFSRPPRRGSEAACLGGSMKRGSERPSACPEQRRSTW